MALTRWILTILIFSGCVNMPTDYADCSRLRYHGYNVLACNDNSVKRHCKRIVDADRDERGLAPLSYHPRACLDRRPTTFNRKPNIIIGKSHMNCLPHEIAHFENPLEPEGWVAEYYPCIGDK